VNTPFQAVALMLETLMTPEFQYDFKLRLYHRAGAYLRASSDSPWLRPWLEELRALQARDQARGRQSAHRLPAALSPETLEPAIGYLGELLREERAESVVNELAGRLLEQEIISGALQPALFDDVSRMAERWKKRGVPSAVLSVLPRSTIECILEHSNRGDLRDAFGQLVSAPTPQAIHDDGCYRALAQQLGVAPESLRVGVCEIEEAFAASNAGCQVVVLERKGVMNSPSHRFRVEVTLLAF
jgi:methionine salvage enolase-phosphatase E1